MQSTCTVSLVKPTDNPCSLASTPNYKSVSGSNNLLASQASPKFTSASNDQAMPSSTTKHVVVDSSESIDTFGRSDSSNSDTEDETGGVAVTVLGIKERGVSGTPISSSHSINTRWTVLGLELYSIPIVRLVDVFQNSGDEGDLFASKCRDPERIIRSKDIVYEMREQHGIHLLFNKAYRSNEHALNQMARTRGVLLVAVCKDENGMIYSLEFGFANSECIESRTWFLKKLRKLIQYPDHVMLVSDRHNGIFNAIEAIFPDASHGICAYHLA
ncbi:hypothetical protein Ddye_017052 [Dipteronia dyeriana]|uniref:MULE transposase domain-containing protein n=1 Tax=Dipteronia dyeriana TaxID=168575 RepID=A0AAD9X0N3_9ROSI|nr:hypothetical protein Ddye_017052 [Dipteronia dyeriana]